MNSKEELLYSIAVYLTALSKDDSVQSKAVEQLISAFAIDTSPESFKALSHYPLNLEEIFAAGVTTSHSAPYASRLSECEQNKKFKGFVDAVAAKGYYAGVETDSVEYMERHAKVILKFNSKANTKGVADEKAAEEKKNEGNACISSKNYAGAVKAYTEAIEISPEGPSTHIYFTNRAAGHCYLKNYREAINDCKSAIALNSSYVKAYSRLGLANFFLEDYEQAISAYSVCVELEPENNASKESLRQAQAKLDEKQNKEVSAASSSSSSQGMPDLASLMGGGGGMPAGLDQLMSNPAIAQMAQEMMKNPAMMQQAMQMMQGGGAGRGGAPDMAAMAQMMKGLEKGGNGR
jgi:small glutamine-rich tetratricopeptide repeat-containing protein alpha